MTSVFTLLLSSQPELAARIGMSPEVIADATAEECFAEADINGDGSVTFDEFQEWFLHRGGSQVWQALCCATET